MRLPPSGLVLLGVLSLTRLTGCIEGKIRPDGAPLHDARTADHARDRAEGGASLTGPGPWGALPTGYCCSADTECRFRRCLEQAGGKMCADVCYEEKDCATSPGFTCVVGTPRTCQPKDAQVRCLAAASYPLGQTELGHCCQTFRTCIGGHCGQSGAWTNPEYCTHPCINPDDCPTNYRCGSLNDRLSICLRTDDPYTCAP